MRYIVEYNRIKKKCKLSTVQELTSGFELWVFKKQLHVILKYTRSGVFTAIFEIFSTIPHSRNLFLLGC